MLLALVTLVLAQLEPAPEAERDASRAWTDCLSGQAARLDDGTSDAGSVAQGVATACVSEFLRMRDVYGRGADPTTLADLTARLERGVTGQAIRAVLEVRKRNRDAAPRPAQAEPEAPSREPPPPEASPQEALPQQAPAQEAPPQEAPIAPPPEPSPPPPDAPLPTQP